MVGLHRHVFVSALPDVSCRSMFCVVVPGVSREQPLHPASDVTVSRRSQYQVHVIWHQAKSKNRNFEAQLRFLHESNERNVVRGAVEDICFSIRAIEDVITLVRDDQSRRARHSPNLV